MIAYIKLYSKKNGEINNFLSKYYNSNMGLENQKKFKKQYSNPTEIADIIGVFIDNLDKFNIKMWISLDKNVLINITPNNAENIIKYLFERYPY